MSTVVPPNYFKQKYGPLNGRDWIRQIDPDDRKALSRVAFAASGYGIVGGMIRAETAKRDSNGRFLPNK